MFLSPGKTWIIDHPSGDRQFISKRFFRVRDFSGKMERKTASGLVFLKLFYSWLDEWGCVWETQQQSWGGVRGDTAAENLCKSSKEGQGSHHIKKLGNAKAETTGAWVEWCDERLQLETLFLK